MTNFNEKLIFHIDVNSAFLSWSAANSLKQGEKKIGRAHV